MTKMALAIEERLEASGQQLQQVLGRPTLPDTLIVLGSGFKGFEARLSDAVTLPVENIAHFPVPRVEGHGASLVVGTLEGREVVVMTGRVHLYEGYEASEVVYPIRALSRLGVRNVLLTNACGSVDRNLRPGSVVLVEDHINLTGRNCLASADARDLGQIFIDMGCAYDRAWREAIAAVASQVSLRVEGGIYCGLLGPSYETPAETAMLARLGANVVGMSTVQEVIAARQLGLKTVCLAFVTNMTGGLGSDLSHQEVLGLAQSHQVELHRLLGLAAGVCPR